MARGYGLLVGLTEVDPAAYGGWDGRDGCEGCARDARALRLLLEPLGYSCTLLLSRRATARGIIGKLRDASGCAEPGDILVFGFSGHGAQRMDDGGDESDGLDETLVAFDREILDDELAAVWPLYREGVRIVMVSDSCNAGTNHRAPGQGADLSAPRRRAPRAGIERVPGGPRARGGRWRPRKAAPRLRAQLIHIGACRDGESAVGLEAGGVFTRALVRAWAGGRFRGGYPELFRKVRKLVAEDVEEQHVEYSELGPVSDGFRSQRPFTVG